MADMQEMSLAVPSCDFVIVISNVSNLFNSSQKEFFKYLIKGIQQMPKDKRWANVIRLSIVEKHFTKKFFVDTNLTGTLFSVCNIEMVILILPVAVNNFLEYHGFA